LLTQLQSDLSDLTLPETNCKAFAAHEELNAASRSYSRDDQTRLATGKLQTIDNQIDPTTGTAKLKAYSTTRQQLWPNQFVNANLLLRNAKE